MALIEPFMVKSEFGLTANECVELEAKTGESLLVKDVIVMRCDDEYILLEIEKTTVGFFRTDAHVLGSHLFPSIALTSVYGLLRGIYAGGKSTLISYMIDKGWMRGYPVAEGQTFRVKPYTTGKKLGNVVIIYEKYDAGDIKSTDDNGSDAKTYCFVNYGRPSSSLTTAGDYEIDTCVTTKEFPDFPFKRTVPSKMMIEVLGILGSESIDYDASDDYTYTKYVKMFKGRTCLFDSDKKGLPFYQPTFSGISSGTHFGRGLSLIGNYSHYDRREPFVLPKPIVFGEGEELKVYITASQASNAGEIGVKYAELGFIERVRIAE